MRELHVPWVFLYGAFGGNHSIITQSTLVITQLSDMAFKRFTLFSRKMLLLLLLVASRSDSRAIHGRTLTLDPGVSMPLCFSAQSGGRVLPDPGLFLSVVTCQELSDSLYDLSKSFMLSTCLLGSLKIFCRYLITT